MSDNIYIFKEGFVRKMYFQKSNLTIQFVGKNGTPFYEIDLEECIDSASILDWIYQVQSKNWANPEVMFALLWIFDNAVKEIFGGDVQATFCPCGNHETRYWNK